MVALELHPLPLPPSANVQKLACFGREVRGLDAENLKDDELQAIEKALYDVCNCSVNHAAEH